MTIVESEADTLFTAQPEAARIPALRHHVNETLVRDLGQYIASAAPLLPRTAAAASRTVRHIAPTRRLNPHLFTLHWMLQGALRTQQPGGVLTALGRLARTGYTGECYRPAFTVDTVRWDLADAEASAFLLSKDGPRSRLNEVVEITDVPASELDQGRRRIDDALTALRELDPAMHGEFSELVATVRLFRRPAITGSTTTGISSLRYWGQMYLRYPDPREQGDWTVFLLEHLVHEASHILLHALMSRDPLLTNGFTARHEAPIRSDRRPLYGIYHAMFVLSRVHRVLTRYAGAVATPTARAARDLALKRFQMGYATVMEHADLTAHGHTVAASCKEIVAA
ncbi:HEXXH motif-containing putative peptide modification protein [Streptomyces sp. NPDC049555]|uniref:aKG-HExxH-type peptide beta-hydroxylase n=1 Tax=unclassified Streptomyces TaxID=2593676 RepID=UPI00344981C6